MDDMKLEHGDKCIECGEEATVLVYSRHRGSVVKACDMHVDFIVEEDSPEYEHWCENCACLLPIN